MKLQKRVSVSYRTKLRKKLVWQGKKLKKFLCTRKAKNSWTWRTQLELKLDNEKKTAEVIKTQKAEGAKLPKLKITRLNGMYQAWLPMEVNSADLAPVSKFTYLKELLKPKIRVSIDDLKTFLL